MSWIAKLPPAAKAYLDHNRLDEVECIIGDLPGIARGKAVPAAKWERQDYFHLPESIFFQTITGDWGEAGEAAGPAGFTEPDMVLRPDMATATAAPWTADGTLQVIHDAYKTNGEPIGFSPRNVLKHVVAKYAEKGLTPIVAFWSAATPTLPRRSPPWWAERDALSQGVRPIRCRRWMTLVR